MLQLQPGVTADQVAEQLGVTGRAARRYIAILREAGVPVESARGRYGGYRLGRGVRLPPVVFTEDEALALVMAVLESHQGHPGPTGERGPPGSGHARSRLGGT
jgi:predicted DNA-binding transcriptional regulator YafY